MGERALEGDGVFSNIFLQWLLDLEKFIRDIRNKLEFEKLFQEIKGFEMLECFITGDVRNERKNERWLNVIVRKRQ